MTLTKYSGQYEELFTGCAAYYDGSYSGTTLYNIINPTQNATMGANVSIIADRNGLIKSFKTNPSSVSDSTAIITCYPQSGNLYGFCGWVYFPVDSSSLPLSTISFGSTNKELLTFGNFSSSISGEIISLQQYNTGGTTIKITYTTGGVSAGWHFIAIIWRSAGYYITSVDGIWQSNSIFQNHCPLITLSSSHKIGYYIPTTAYYSIQLSEYMVFTSLMTLEQVYTLYKLTKSKYLYPVQSGIRGVE